VSKALTSKVTPLLFLVEGAFWVGMIATGSGVLLGWAAVTSLASGVVLLGAPSNPFSRPLAGASVLFGLTLTIYQMYAASTILGTTQSTVGAYSAGLFLLFTVVYLYLLVKVVVNVPKPKA
jgi:hypothetical protein